MFSVSQSRGQRVKGGGSGVVRGGGGGQATATRKIVDDFACLWQNTRTPLDE